MPPALSGTSTSQEAALEQQNTGGSGHIPWAGVRRAWGGEGVFADPGRPAIRAVSCAPWRAFPFVAFL
ncbi:hypothetical protein DVH05_000683 [Phytophthora capsici]|nr:hypothetical protein DVH05_000683 [Phytophthora capsici]